MTQDWLDEIQTTLRENIVSELRVKDANIHSAKMIIKLSVDDIKKAANREKYKDRLNYIDKVVNINSKYIEYFIGLIQNTNIDNLQALMIRYAEQLLEI
jgi:ribonucleotide reductase beta subunit family protein with ferritin-like domain